MGEPIWLPEDIERCPYCFSPIVFSETGTPFSPELIDFYKSIGIFFWKHDPLKTCHGTKYKWYDKEYPDEYFYKNKLYTIYDKLPDPITGGLILNNPRKDIGFNQITLQELKELQDSRKFLEEYIGIDESKRTEFSDLTQLDEGSSKNQQKKKYIQELYDSTIKIASFLNISPYNYFNYTENGKFVIRKDINQKEWIQESFFVGNIAQWKGHARNTHIEDLRHNILGYWIEDWQNINHSYNQTYSGSNFSITDGFLIENIVQQRFWEIYSTFNSFPQITYGYGFIGNSNITASDTINENIVIRNMTMSVSGSIAVSEGNHGGKINANLARGLYTVLSTGVTINKKTKIYIENFTQTTPAGIIGDFMGGANIDQVSLRFYTVASNGYFSLILSLPAIGSGSEYDPLITIQDGNDLTIFFENSPQYWGKTIYYISLYTFLSAYARAFQSDNYPYTPRKIITENGNFSLNLSFTLGKIYIYPISFQQVPSNVVVPPTGWEERIVDPLPE